MSEFAGVMRNQILEKGELQVSEKERKEDYESKNKELVTLITNKCVNRETKRPFPPRIVRITFSLRRCGRLV